MKKPAIIFLTALLLLAISFIGYSRISQKGQENKILPAEVLLHKNDNTSIIINPSDPSYQEIENKTNKIINNSILVPRERQQLLSLLVDPSAFPKEMEQSDYIEVQPKQALKVEGQTSEYDKLRFVLSGRYEGIIFLHAASPRDYWGGWSSFDEKIFWSLREFLGLPPHPTAGTPALHQETSPLQ